MPAIKHKQRRPNRERRHSSAPCTSRPPWSTCEAGAARPRSASGSPVMRSRGTGRLSARRTSWKGWWTWYQGGASIPTVDGDLSTASRWERNGMWSSWLREGPAAMYCHVAESDESTTGVLLQCGRPFFRGGTKPSLHKKNHTVGLASNRAQLYMLLITCVGQQILSSFTFGTTRSREGGPSP